MLDHVILVDTHDNQIGTEEKLTAHQKGLLHRAFSIFIFNHEGKMLIHQRAFSKYHSGGLWTNACCSHPRPGESLEDSTHRRLREELGFDCSLQKMFHFTYKVNLANDGLFEHEFDHVFFGSFDGIINPNPDEIATVAWVTLEDLTADIKLQPERYTYWFLASFDKVLAYAQDYIQKARCLSQATI